ncbi:MAG: hypothetical protein IPP23_07435 [Sphingomonadales bacterium]|nr:hypothetical protein [Sphingomonadales bacterium]
MSQPVFPPNVAAALDRLTVPPLPEGFSDRLLARLAAGDMPLESEAAPKLPEPRQRRILGGRWRRSGFIVGSVGLLGMATATAAAAGIFGEPIYLPVVSEALAKADLVENPKVKARPKRRPNQNRRVKTITKGRTRRAERQGRGQSCLCTIAGQSRIQNIASQRADANSSPRNRQASQQRRSDAG